MTFLEIFQNQNLNFLSIFDIYLQKRTPNTLFNTSYMQGKNRPPPPPYGIIRSFDAHFATLAVIHILREIVAKKYCTEISHCHRLPSIHQSISCHVNSNTRGHSTHPCGTGCRRRCPGPLQATGRDAAGAGPVAAGVPTHGPRSSDPRP